MTVGMQDGARHLLQFSWGILSRVYYWGFALFLDPFDMYSRFKLDSWPAMLVPNWVGLVALGLLLFWSAFLTYHDLAKSIVGRPDYEKWDKKERFSLAEVACLWVDQEPRQHLGSAASRKFKWLGKSIQAKQLAVIKEDMREVIADSFTQTRGGKVKANPNWQVNRDAVLDFAVAVSQKPPFLFPKERVR